MNDEPNNVQNAHQVTIQNRSERNGDGSEQTQNSSERFRTNGETIPHRSEQTTVRSEHVQNETPEQHRTAPNCSEAHTKYTITVREAARIFEEGGVPRTERAITNWCNQNARGITRLAACYNETERKYYLTSESIEQAIKEERRKAQSAHQIDHVFSEDAEELSEQVRNEQLIGSEDVPNGAERNSERSEQMRNGSERQEQNVPNKDVHEQPTDTSGSQQREGSVDNLRELQMENYELKVQLEGQKHLIRKFDELTDKERSRHERETMALVDRLTDARHQIGSLEQQLLQLEAPKSVVRDVEVKDNEENKERTVVENSQQGADWQRVVE